MRWYSTQTVYNIKQAASRTGVSVALLRAWERRYGIVAPERTAAGYRLYDDAAIERLRAMRHLVDDGWSASSAAASLRAAGADAIRAINGLPAAPRGEPTVAEAEPLVDRFVAAAAALDADAVETTLDEIFARGSFERVAADYVFPALRALGDAWAAGTLDVAAEHAASHAVLRRLAAAFQAAGRAGPGAVLVGLPPGARHELGALAFAIVARRAGLPIVYLGADVPEADWTRAVNETAAQAVVIGAVTTADLPAAEALARTLLQARPGLVIAFGGPATVPGQAVDGAMRLPVSLAAAVASLQATLSA